MNYEIFTIFFPSLEPKGLSKARRLERAYSYKNRRHHKHDEALVVRYIFHILLNWP